MSSCREVWGLGWVGGEVVGWLAEKRQKKECYFGSCCKDLWENSAGLTALL